MTKRHEKWKNKKGPVPARHARAGDKKSRAEMGEGMGMRCRMKSRLCAVPAAAGFLAVVCLLAALPRTAALARGLIDTGKECSLTVKTEIQIGRASCRERV